MNGSQSFFSKKSNLFALIILGTAILAMNIPAVNLWVKNQFYLITAPLERYSRDLSAKLTSFPVNFFGAADSQEINKLKNRIIELEGQIIQFNSVQKENQQLHEILNLGLDKTYDLKMADIIGKDIANDNILINKGSNDAVAVGFPVINSNKAVIGRISKVYANFSKVELISAKGNSFDVYVGDELIEGLARGQGNLKLKLDLVPKDKNIATGMLVTTSPLGGIFPKNLIVGSIGEVEKNDTKMFQQAEIIPVFDIAASSVFIIMKANDITNEINSPSNDDTE